MAANPKVAVGGGSTPPVPYAIAEAETVAAAILYSGAGIVTFAHTFTPEIGGAVTATLAALGTALLIVRRIYP